MATWTHADLLQLDARYAEEGVNLHARPMRAALDLIGGDLVTNVLTHHDFRRIVDAYEALVPEVSATWPGFGIGIIASVDRVRRIVLGVPFGQPRPQAAWQVLGFESVDAFAVWCRHDIWIRDQAVLAATDMLDIAHGLDGDDDQHPDARRLWRMARSNLEDVATILPATFSVDTVLQPICMTVELALKAILVRDGADPDGFKGPKGHDLAGLARRVTDAHPHADDPRLHAIISSLPPYVASRYSPAGLARLAVVQLALGAQFVLASTLRRVRPGA